MNKKKNKKASEMLPLNNPTLSEAQCGEQRGDSLASACDEGADFTDLQPLFDDHTCRLAAILDRPETRPTSLNFSDAHTFRLRMARAWGILALLCIAVTIFWGIALWHFNYDIYYRLFTLFLELVYILLTVESVVTTLAIFRHDPASTPFDRMLRYSSRFGMRPLYLPRKKSRFATLIAQLRARREAIATAPTTLNSSFSILNLKRTATIGIAASFTLVLIACTTTVGDGHTITQDHNARIEAVDNVTHTIMQI